jgi:DNA-binding LacI/PurR family transcriptional regulator
VVLRPQHALSVLTALTNSGFRVPGAASLISIGHEPFLDHARPSVAHYKIERPFCGRTLSRMILSWVRTGHWSPERQAIRMRFQDGQSLGAVR